MSSQGQYSWGLSINDITLFHVEGVRNCVKVDESLDSHKKVGGVGEGGHCALNRVLRGHFSGNQDVAVK